MNTYLILPGCDDTNRGDQALIWETKALAEAAGYQGQYYMLAEKEKSMQSHSQGIQNIDYILHHPSTFFNRKSSNMQYGFLLKIKWGLVSILSMVKCLPLLNCHTRKIALLFLTPEELNTYHIFSSTTAAFVKGGGFLHANGGLTETYKIFYFLYHILLAQSFHIPVYILPNSIGPFDAPLVKWMVNKVFCKCKVIMVRESISQHYLKETCSIETIRMPDLGFFLTKDDDFNPIETLSASGIRLSPGKSVAITVRPYRFPGHSNGIQLYENYKQSTAQFIEWLCKEGYYPVMVEHVYSDLEHEQDIACINEIRKLIPDECHFGCYSDLALNCKQMKRLYGVFDYMIGTRFHSVIFSIAENTPSIAITYGGNKGVGIMKDMNLSQYSCPMEEVTLEKLIKMFMDMANDQNLDNVLKNINESIDAEKKHIQHLLNEDQ